MEGAAEAPPRRRPPGRSPKNLLAPFENPKDSRNSQLSRKGKDECFINDLPHRNRHSIPLTTSRIGTGAIIWNMSGIGTRVCPFGDVRAVTRIRGILERRVLPGACGRGGLRRGGANALTFLVAFAFGELPTGESLQRNAPPPAPGSSTLDPFLSRPLFVLFRRASAGLPSRNPAPSGTIRHRRACRSGGNTHSRSRRRAGSSFPPERPSGPSSRPYPA